jgi:hypothetical protein
MYEDMRAAVNFLKEVDFELPGEDVRAYKM